jgi:hypothetical protein
MPLIYGEESIEDKNDEVANEEEEDHLWNFNKLF